MLKKISTVFAMVMLMSSVAFAQDAGSQDGGQQRGGRRHGPPEEAIAACSGAASGDSCTFQITGTCENSPRGDQVACRPEHGGPRGARGQRGGSKPVASE